jgi:hypothetical protein
VFTARYGLGSDPSEPAVSSETAPGRMSTDMSRPLSGMPVGTTFDAHVANPCLPAGKRPKKTPIFITGFGDTRAFLAWLRSSCPCDLTAQLKAEKLMVVPSTADGFRATVSALRSLDGGEGVRFHTSLPEDRCVRLLVKNLGKRMPESAVREELGSLNIRVQGVMQLRSGRRDQDPAKDRPPTPTSLCLWREVRRWPECALSSSSTVCGSRWRRTWRQRAHSDASVASPSAIRSETADTLLGASRVGALTSLVIARPRGDSLGAAAVGATTRRTTVDV